jgi:hypothetical protein
MDAIVETETQTTRDEKTEEEILTGDTQTAMGTVTPPSAPGCLLLSHPPARHTLQNSRLPRMIAESRVWKGGHMT